MPNPINTESFVNLEYQSKERIQPWIDAIADNKRYCFYIAVGLADSEIAYPLGNWNIPFYSFEEANQFKSAACILIDIVISYHYTQIVEFGVLLKS